MASDLAGRLDDMEMPIPEFEQVREMSAITLGRIKPKTIFNRMFRHAKQVKQIVL